MEQIVVYRKGKENLRLNRIKASNESGIISAHQEREDIGKDIVRVEMESASLIDLRIGDYIEIFGDRYVLNVAPNIEKTSERSLKYIIEFEGKHYDMLKTTFIDVDSKYLATGGIFTMIGTLDVFASLIVNNLNRDSSNEWELGDIETSINTTQTLPFSDNNCLQVAQQLCELYEVSFYVERIGTEKWKLHFKKKTEVVPHLFKYGRNNGLYSITQEPVKEGGLINRLFVYGAQKNLPSNYRGGSIRLKLPRHIIPYEALPYIQDLASINKYGVVEGSITYEDVFPSREGKVTAVGGTSYDFFDIGMDFNLTETINGVTTYLINGTTAKIVFTSGDLTGYEFEISNYDHGTKMFTLNPYTDENGIIFPDNTVLARSIKNGDRYIIYDIQLPQSYISNAEMELLKRGRETLAKLKDPLFNYSVMVDHFFVANKAPNKETIINYFEIGHHLKIETIDGELREMPIKSFRRDILRHYVYELVLGDPKSNANRKRFIQSVRVGSTVNNLAVYNVGKSIRPTNNNNQSSQIAQILSIINQQATSESENGGPLFVDVPTDEDLEDVDVTNYAVGTRFLWLGFGIYELVEGEPSDGYYLQSSIDSNLYFWAIDNTEWVNHLSESLSYHLTQVNPHSITPKMIGAWSSLVGLATVNKILKVSNTTDFLLQDSLLSDDGSTLSYSGQTFRLPTIIGSIPLINNNIGVDAVTNKIKAVLGGARVDLLTSGVIGVPKVIWVDSVNGTDTRTGISKYSIDTPFKTLTAAVATASASTDIIHAIGSFTENITWNSGIIYFSKTTLNGNLGNVRSAYFSNGSSWKGVPTSDWGPSVVGGEFVGDKTSTWEITANVNFSFNPGTIVKYVRGFKRIFATSGFTSSLFSGYGMTGTTNDAIVALGRKEPYLIVEDIDIIECAVLVSQGNILFRNIRRIECSVSVFLGGNSRCIHFFDNIDRVISPEFASMTNGTMNVWTKCASFVFTSATVSPFRFTGAGSIRIYSENTKLFGSSDYLFSMGAGVVPTLKVNLLNCTLVANVRFAHSSGSKVVDKLSMVNCIGNLPPASIYNTLPTIYEEVNYQQITELEIGVI